ncbi:MAG TPA: cyclic nucleotide-binding domain-containing protein [Gaiellales bacterium]|nr:cyclic nucleotide-binding domain-containing protein [Gaiellales bacterium]
MPDLASYRASVARSVVFEGVEGTDLERVLSRCRLVDAKPGELLLSEGTPGDGLYIVLEGQIEVFLPERAGPGGRRPTRVRLARLGPGRCLGEYGVIDDQPSSASVTAVTPARLCFLPKAQFRALVEDDDHLGRRVYANLLRYLVSRLRSKDRELDVVLLADRP